MTAPPTDFGVLSRSGGLVDRYLEDLDEIIDQLHVAGIAFPDLELVAALDPLAARATALGLATPALALQTLAQALTGVQAGEPVAAAFDTLQRLVAWRRLFETAHQLALVSGRLASQCQKTAVDVPKPPTWSGECWPIGLALDTAGRAFIYALDLATGQAIGLRDHLSDLHPNDPFRRAGISRLFQARVAVERMLGAIIRLSEHPVSTVGGTLHFAPAFDAVAERIEVSDTFDPPEVEEAHPETLQRLQGAAWTTVTVVDTPEGLAVLGPDDRALAVEFTPQLTLNLIKWQLGDGYALPVTVLGAGSALRVLSATDLSGQRVFPDLDPRCFRLWPSALFQQAIDADEGSPAGLWRLTWAATMGGAADDALDRIVHRWSALETPSATDNLRRHLALRAFGRPTEDKAEAAAALGALVRVVVWQDAIKAPAADIGLLMGLSPRVVRQRKIRALDDRTLWSVVHWAALTNALDEDEASVRQLYAARFEHLPSVPSVAEVCARALLLAWIGLFDAESEAADYDEPPSPAEQMVLAHDFLEAHLKSLRGGHNEGAPQPLPDLWGVHALATCWALVRGESTYGPIVADLELPEVPLAIEIASALKGGPLGSEWGDALSLLAAGGPTEWLIV